MSKTAARPPALVTAFFFGAVNVFLFIVPFIRPPAGADPYMTLPYWTHAIAGWGVFGTPSSCAMRACVDKFSAGLLSTTFLNAGTPICA